MPKFTVKLEFLIPGEDIIEVEALNKEEAVNKALHGQGKHKGLLTDYTKDPQPNYYIADDDDPLATSVGVKVEEA